MLGLQPCNGTGIDAFQAFGVWHCASIFKGDALLRPLFPLPPTALLITSLINNPACGGPAESPQASAMDQYGDLGMGEYLDRLAAKDDRGDTVAPVRGDDDQVAAFRLRGIDDCLVRMLMLDMDHLA